MWASGGGEGRSIDPGHALGFSQHCDDGVLTSKAVCTGTCRRMPRISLDHRLATRADMPALGILMNAAIGELQKPFLTEEQIASSRAIMGLDTQLIDDGTYFVVEQDGLVAACGGWSRRATLYGGDSSPGRDAAPLDPAKDAARVRAMYTHRSFTRRGLGRLILMLCEDAARTEGFTCRAYGDNGWRAAIPRLRL